MTTATATTTVTKPAKKRRVPPPGTVPADHKVDSMGRMVHISLVSGIDLARDELVTELVTDAKRMNKAIVEFKQQTFIKADGFVALSLAQYGRSLGGTKGNITLTSYDGRYRVVLPISEVVSFDERLQAAKGLIDEYLAELCDAADPDLVTVINHVFRTDGAGKVSVSMVLSLRRYPITEPRWVKAMQIIGESLQVIGSKRYMRFYERQGESDAYAAIPIDAAAV